MTVMLTEIGVMIFMCVRLEIERKNLKPFLVWTVDIKAIGEIRMIKKLGKMAALKKWIMGQWSVEFFVAMD